MRLVGERGMRRVAAAGLRAPGLQGIVHVYRLSIQQQISLNFAHPTMHLTEGFDRQMRYRRGFCGFDTETEQLADQASRQSLGKTHVSCPYTRDNLDGLRLFQVLSSVEAQVRQVGAVAPENARFVV